jgi:integrase
MDAALIERRRFRDRAFLQLALGTGFRASEILSLVWSQVLTSSGEISDSVTIERAHLKGGAGVRRKAIRSRRVPLNERVRGAVADYLGSLGVVPMGPVFRSRVGDNGAISRVQAHRLLKDLARKLGLDSRRLACHSARKKFALDVHRRAHFDVLKTMRILGHSSPTVTARYVESSQDELDALVLGLDQLPAAPSAISFVASVGTSGGFGDRYVPSRV